MRKILLFFASCLLFPASSWAQNITTVTATVVDPNGIPYSNASVQAQLVPTGTNPTINGQAIAGFTQATADVAGTFSMNLGSNAVILPGGTKWQFTVDENGIPVPLGTGPQSIVASITISGASQNISATLNALAPKLTNFTGGGGTPSNPSGSVQFNNTGAFGGSANFTWNNSTNTLSLSNAAGANALNLANPTAATAIANQSSPTSCITGNFWTGAVSAVDSYCPQNVISAGANPSTILTFVHSGSSFPPIYSFDGALVAGAINASGLTVASSGINLLNIGPLNFAGSVSGSAKIQAKAVQGSPNPIVLPDASATIANSYLVSDANNPQLLSWAVPGVAINAQTGASYTIAPTDRSGLVTDSNAGATAITLPQAGSAGFTNNFNFGLFNINTGLVTITPNTSSINSALSQIVPNKWAAYVYSDNTNYLAGVFPSIAAFPNCTDSAGNHINFTAATGALSCGTSSSGAVSFPLLAPNGTAAAPSYSFTNGTNFGMRFDNSGTPTLIFSAGGADWLGISGTNSITIANNQFIGFSSGGSVNVACDTCLARQGAKSMNLGVNGDATGTLNIANLKGKTSTGIFNFNRAAQSQVVVSATEYYITLSDLDMPAVYTTAIAAGTTMKWRIALNKTAAGTGTFQILLKKGTNGSIADTSIVTQTIGTQTAAADNMEADIQLTWTSATDAYWTIIPRQSATSATGFGLVYPAVGAQFNGTISGQTTTTASDKYGLSVIFTTGTPTFLVTEVQAQAFGVN